MLILLSPAKTLDFESAIPSFASSTQDPSLLKGSQELIKTLKNYSEAELAKLMGLSDKLSKLNVERYQAWTGQGQRPALFAFKGDVYQGLQAETMDEALVAEAEKSLRILSGLYGTLSPLTHIEAHRLEMGTKLATKKAKNLYQFWGEQVTKQLQKALQHSLDQPDQQATVINLASQEYSKVVQWKSLDAQVITPVFKDEKNGKYKVISFYAKRARGLLARHLLETQAQNSAKNLAQNTQKALESFACAGYFYDPVGSTSEAPLFSRSEANRLQYSS